MKQAAPSAPAAEAAQQQAAAAFLEEDRAAGSPWAVLSVSAVGALLASVQGSALIIALPKILTALRIDFLTIMWVLLGYLLITTALVPIAGRLADMVGRKRLYVAGFVLFTAGSLRRPVRVWLWRLQPEGLVAAARSPAAPAARRG